MIAHHTSKKTGYLNRRSGTNVQTWCPKCLDKVRMMLAEKAATVCRCSRRKIYRWIEEGDLHYIEMPGGEVMVCGRSLAKKMDELDCTTNKLGQPDEIASGEVVP
jgi:Helix-turn-helix domain